MNSNRRYFATFDALRFFAFLKVFLLHLPIVSIPVLNFFRDGGEMGVSFFFVLSGFLITYILLTEKEKTKTIDLKNFIVRRILRIWPLYYLMLLFAFCTPFILAKLGVTALNSGYEPNWLMSIFFLENYKMISTGTLPNVSPLAVMWSLCVEEHFYIIWGFLLFTFNTNKVPIFIGVSICVAFISRYIFSCYGWPLLDISTNIDYFAFGAIPAYLLVKSPRSFECFLEQMPRIVKYFVLVLVIFYLFISPYLSFSNISLINPLLLGCLFCVLICMTLPSKNALYVGQGHILTRLGIFTYGLYMYHTIVINLFIHVFKKFQLPFEHFPNAIFFSVLTLFVSILLSIISYYFFERYFLRLKASFYSSRVK